MNKLPRSRIPSQLPLNARADSDSSETTLTSVLAAMSNESSKSSPTLRESSEWSVVDNRDFADHSSNAASSSHGHCQPSSSSDVEDDGNRDVWPFQGWPDLAFYIARNPGFAAFDKFGDLNIKSLLYYQAELDRLRQKLGKAEKDDQQDGQRYHTCTDLLLESRWNEGERSHVQWDLIQDIRRVLREYNAALLQYSQIAALPAPDSHNIKSLKELIQNSSNKSRDEDCKISGFGSETWGPCEGTSAEDKSLAYRFCNMAWHLIWPPSERDNGTNLIAIHQTQKVDGLTRWIARDWTPFYHHVKGSCKGMYKAAKRASPKDPEWGFVSSSSEKHTSSSPGNPSTKTSRSPTTTTTSTQRPSPIERYRLYKMVQFTSALSTIIACLLPTAAIAILSTIHQIENMLIAIAALTAAFAVGLMWMTTPGTSRIEIFTGAATFSAVMVVFVQNQQQANQLQVTT